MSNLQIRALLRTKIPMETDFSTIYRLMRTVCSSVTFDEVIDAMIVFFGPPRQNFEEFLLGFAIRKWNNNSGKLTSGYISIWHGLLFLLIINLISIRILAISSFSYILLFQLSYFHIIQKYIRAFRFAVSHLRIQPTVD